LKTDWSTIKKEGYLMVPSYGEKDNYFSFYLDNDNEPMVSYKFTPIQTISDSTYSNLIKFEENQVMPFRFNTTGKGNINIKAKLSDPLNTCYIRIDYVGCQKSNLNPLPYKENNCESNWKDAKQGDVCSISFKIDSAKTVYFGVEATRTEMMTLEFTFTPAK
jgi:hypothetical protein